MFFVQDGIKFPDFVHAVKPEPHNDIPTGASPNPGARHTADAAGRTAAASRRSRRALVAAVAVHRYWGRPPVRR